MNKSGADERKDRGQNRCANKAQGNPTVIFGGGAHSVPPSSFPEVV